MRPLFSNYSKDQLKNDLIPRMADMASQAMPGLVQKRLVQRDQARTFGGLDRLANYLSSVNLSSSPDHNFDLKGLARPKGKATKVIITSYDLPENHAAA